jgi:hypothetical protein
MSQCVHIFAQDEISGEVKCKRCGDLDDEMQLFNREEELKEAQREKDKFESSQVNFE